ncbi:MAG: hypothetical protein ACJAYU_001896 [Bradymonadia bacterium]|jgi:hypothetical protein
MLTCETGACRAGLVCDRDFPLGPTRVPTSGGSPEIGGPFGQWELWGIETNVAELLWPSPSTTLELPGFRTEGFFDPIRGGFYGREDDQLHRTQEGRTTSIDVCHGNSVRIAGEHVVLSCGDEGWIRVPDTSLDANSD